MSKQDIDIHMASICAEIQVQLEGAREIIRSAEGERSRYLALAKRFGAIQTWARSHQDYFGEALLDSMEQELRAVINGCLRAATTAVDKSVESYVENVGIVSTGRVGRPLLSIEPLWLESAYVELGLPVTVIAKTLQVSRATVSRAVQDLGLKAARSIRHTPLSQDALDELVGTFKANTRTIGRRNVKGMLVDAGLTATNKQIRCSLQKWKAAQPQDPGQAFRAAMNTLPRVYTVAGPNAVWHHDGQLGLVKHGFVIHGFVDGYSRLITALQVSCDNRAETVLEVFSSGVSQYGLPSRVRGDRGGENVQVANFMEEVRGPNRGSYLWGPCVNLRMLYLILAIPAERRPPADQRQTHELSVSGGTSRKMLARDGKISLKSS